MKMLKEMGVKMNSISLDKYYSTRKTLKVFGKETAVYVIPKKNLSRIGFDWLRVIERIIEAPYRFLKRYFKRNLSESGFSANKRRFGWLIRQKRDGFIYYRVVAQCLCNQGEVILSQNPLAHTTYKPPYQSTQF